MSILYLQRSLKAAGFDPGPLDGAWGSRTKAALDAALRTPKPVVVREGAVGAQQAPLDAAPAPALGAPAIDAQPKAARPIWEIVVHCTATPEGRDVSVETIRGWHRKNGWSDIGYHYVVALDGAVQAGRPEANIGAHVAGHNAGTIGISYVGGVDAKMRPKDTRTPAQREALMAACRALIAKYPGIRKVSGHRDYDQGKACPSFDVREDPLGALV